MFHVEENTVSRCPKALTEVLNISNTVPESIRAKGALERITDFTTVVNFSHIMTMSEEQEENQCRLVPNLITRSAKEALEEITDFTKVVNFSHVMARSCEENAGQNRRVTVLIPRSIKEALEQITDFTRVVNFSQIMARSEDVPVRLKRNM